MCPEDEQLDRDEPKSFLGHLDDLRVAVLRIAIAVAVGMLVAIPFTRLSHMLFAPLTRAYMGSEFGGIRHAKDW